MDQSTLGAYLHIPTPSLSPFPSQSSFAIVSMVTGHLIGKMGSTSILPFRRPVKKIKGAAQRWRYV